MSRTDSNAACCRTLPGAADETLPKLLLVGCPNVGKSALFNRLTGAYVAVSNYPGTTVEVSRGKGRWGEREFEVIDTPGMYSLRPLTEEERVARSMLLSGPAEAVLHVVDAKNLPRMLPMTLQLIEARLPLVLVLNMADEMARSGVSIDVPALSESLGVPVVVTSSVTGDGLDALREAILEPRCGKAGLVRYPDGIERAVAAAAPFLGDSPAIDRRAAALLLLQGDGGPDAAGAVAPGADMAAFGRIARATRDEAQGGIDYVLALARQQAAQRLCGPAYRSKSDGGLRFAERMSRWMMHPLYGVPILLASLLALYEFVGVFGAQTAVEFLENTVFEERINPYLIRAAADVVPWGAFRDLLVGEYGVLTLGLRYAVALILPIVATFFIAFSVIEDTGYLPRLAMLIDRIFKAIGLSGRAVIPMVLGFGCDTMATMVTRTLETKRERVLATLLLSLAVPCSAQLGVIFALLAGSPRSLLVWGVVMTLNFLLVGWLAAKVMPGTAPLFYMEVPPLRLPRWRNVLTKTYTRVEWYFREILPMFLWASVAIWLGRLTGLFDRAVSALEPAVTFIGLPVETAVSFLFGFFRRDYGAAGLYDLKQAGALHGVPLVVAVVAMTLFLPCVAQFTMTVKERGWKCAAGMAAFIFPYAFLVSFLVGKALPMLGVSL